MTEQKLANSEDKSLKVGDEVWFCSEVRRALYSVHVHKISITANDVKYYDDEGDLISTEKSFPTREDAKAALIEKLEDALEEAKGL